MKTLTLEAPAKINLTLDILGRRTDGYHDMRMVMQAVSLGDTVTVAEAAGGFSLLTEGISLPAGKVTLEQRAADAFFHRLGRPVPGLEVRLAKRVPAYAGLGGGSADVAAVLRCLRTLYAPDLPRQALEEIGLAVGSDVPFCVRGGTCLAEGRGEILTDLPPLPDCAIVLCKPDFGLPTPELFARLDAQFHMTLAEFIDNPIISNVMGQLLDQTVCLNINRVFGYYGGIYYHPKIAEAIAQRSCEQARNIMKTHMVSELFDPKEHRKNAISL
mgnify:CR=1 FL=1